MEQEARDIITHALAPEMLSEEHLVDRIRRRVEPLGGIDLPVIPREAIREPLKLGD